MIPFFSKKITLFARLLITFAILNLCLYLVQQHLDLGLLPLLHGLVRVRLQGVKVWLTAAGHQDGGEAGPVPDPQHVFVRAKLYVGYAFEELVLEVRVFEAGFGWVLVDLDLVAEADSEQVFLAKVEAGRTTSDLFGRI